MTEIYLHIVARMADYMATHPYGSGLSHDFAGRREYQPSRDMAPVQPARPRLHPPRRHAPGLPRPLPRPVRLHILRHARNKTVGKSESCMVSGPSRPSHLEGRSGARRSPRGCPRWRATSFRRCCRRHRCACAPLHAWPSGGSGTCKDPRARARALAFALLLLSLALGCTNSAPVALPR